MKLAVTDNYTDVIKSTYHIHILIMKKLTVVDMHEGIIVSTQMVFGIKVKQSTKVR